MHDIVHNGGGNGRSHYTLQWLDSDASGPTASDRCHPGGEDFADCLYQHCLHALQDFYRQERNHHSSSSHSIVLRECLGRFYLWGEPFGAGDLDEALRQSEELRDNVLERLGHIGKLLLRSLSNTPSQPLHQLSKQIKELESFVKQSKPITHGDQDEVMQDDRETDEENLSETEDLSDSGSYDITEDIDFTVKCLTELGPSLAQNLQHAENARDQQLCLAGVPFSVSGPAKIYVSLVREKFAKAPYRLVERLGEANWQRHMDIREKMESTEKLTSKTGVACSIFRPYSDFHDSGIGTSVPAQTDYAPSHTSFQSSNIEGNQVSLRVPREPAEVSAGQKFECFLCKRIISNVRNRVDWKMHVFADLRPYICTFSDCKDELAQFTTRAAWADHEFTEHRNDQTWNCPECSAKLADALSWEQHLHEIHRRVFTGPQLHVARNAALKTHPRPVETEECPLCRIVLGKQRRAFIKHIGRHMEEIALMALPRDTEEDSDDGSASTDQTSQGLGNQEVLAAKTGSETSEETSPHQTDSRATSSGRCHSCNRAETSKWRRGPDGAGTLCNACGLHYAKLSKKMSAVDRQGQTGQENEAATTLLHSPEENVTRCVCGNRFYPGPPALPRNSVLRAAKGNKSAASLEGAFCIQCDSCKVWQHGGCVGIASEAMSPDHYYCEQCRKDLHKIRTSVDGRQCSLYIPVQESRSSIPLQVAHPSQNPAPAPGDEIEDYIIKCICGFLEDDGNTIYCDLCNTWQHTQCYYTDKHGNVPTKAKIEVIDHFCVDCQPRLLNYKGAIERQRTRREHLERNSTTTATVEEQKKAGTSSYWSVAEQHECYNYIRDFGTNWEAISTKLTTKTPQMVKNFYNRKIEDGEFGKKLEEDGARADGRRAKGVNMGLQPPGQDQGIGSADYRNAPPFLWPAQKFSHGILSDSPNSGMITASSERAAAGKEMEEDGYTTYVCGTEDCGIIMLNIISDEQLSLHGVLNRTGRPAELVRIKDGQAISLRTGEILNSDTAVGPNDDLHYSMVRRRKSEQTIVKQAQRCNECHREFKRPCDLIKHEKTHLRPWKCSEPNCKYSLYGWTTEKDRDRHFNDLHSAPNM